MSAGSAAAPARRKPAATTSRKKREVAPAEPVASLSAPADGAADVTTEVRATVEVATEPTYEQIANLAYTLWEARGCQGGNPEDDWLAAEQQLRTRS